MRKTLTEAFGSSVCFDPVPKSIKGLCFRLAAAIKVIFGVVEKEHTVATQMLLCDVAVRKKEKGSHWETDG